MILRPVPFIGSRTHLSASLTHVRFFSSMNSLVYSQGRALDELFAATGVIADVRPNTAMDTL